MLLSPTSGALCVFLSLPAFSSALFQMAFNEHFLDADHQPKYINYPEATPNECYEIPQTPSNFIQYIIMRISDPTNPPNGIAFYKSRAPNGSGPHCTFRHLETITRYYPQANSQQWFSTKSSSGLTHFKILRNDYSHEWDLVEDQHLQPGGMLYRIYLNRHDWTKIEAAVERKDLDYDWTGWVEEDDDDDDDDDQEWYPDDYYYHGAGMNPANPETVFRVPPVEGEEDELEKASVDTAAYTDENKSAGEDEMNTLADIWSNFGIDDPGEDDLDDENAMLEDDIDNEDYDDEYYDEYGEEQKKTENDPNKLTYWEKLEKLRPQHFVALENERARRRNQDIQRGIYTPIPENRRDRPLEELYGYGYYIDPKQEFAALKKEWAEDKFSDWKEENGVDENVTADNLTPEQKKSFVLYLQAGGPPDYYTKLYLQPIFAMEQAALLRFLAINRPVIRVDNLNSEDRQALITKLPPGGADQVEEESPFPG
ncbi:hypothetical protein H072_4984 [Dactylellina haptotyla CBS 200.50]|uniref:Uncharacterized protein n=1 Tax=Dactylellina haptotyla (strain CBS 200.50) TaxID=1284197 RepID=S8AJ20_DACHA|nr:hypothetical protein H072_4984 [Dactylellina haptotyla CBS 200.50]